MLDHYKKRKEKQIYIYIYIYIYMKILRYKQNFKIALKRACIVSSKIGSLLFCHIYMYVYMERERERERE